MNHADAAAALPGGWLLPLKGPAEPRLRVIVCPPAGGHPAAFRPLAGQLGPDVEVFGAHLPGRLGRLGEAPLRLLSEVVQGLAGALPSDGLPLVLLGHSFGAHVAYELVRHLSAAGEGGVAGIIVAASPAPGRARLREMALHELPDDELVAELRALGGVPDALWEQRALVRRLLPGARADLEAFAVHRHRPGPRLSCPALVLAGDRDPLVPLASALAWADELSRVRTVVLPAGHFLFEEALEPALAAMRRHLDLCVPPLDHEGPTT
ncbi:MAG TPA: alpha/beta fold hydrolase [Thermoleophilaceae bacterium]|jgi:surfactin synthase thioesterase subunit